MEIISCRYNIQEIIEEMGVGDEAIYDLYKTYFSEMRENINEITEFVQNNQWNEVGRVLHNIKGVSINLSIVDVHKAASTFNELIKLGIYENSQIHIKNLVQLTKQAEDEVKNFFRKKGIQT